MIHSLQLMISKVDGQNYIPLQYLNNRQPMFLRYQMLFPSTAYTKCNNAKQLKFTQNCCLMFPRKLYNFTPRQLNSKTNYPKFSKTLQNGRLNFSYWNILFISKLKLCVHNELYSCKFLEKKGVPYGSKMRLKRTRNYWSLPAVYLVFTVTIFSDGLEGIHYREKKTQIHSHLMTQSLTV